MCGIGEAPAHTPRAVVSVVVAALNLAALQPLPPRGDEATAAVEGAGAGQAAGAAALHDCAAAATALRLSDDVCAWPAWWTAVR